MPWRLNVLLLQLRVNFHTAEQIVLCAQIVDYVWLAKLRVCSRLSQWKVCCVERDKAVAQWPTLNRLVLYDALVEHEKLEQMLTECLHAIATHTLAYPIQLKHLAHDGTHRLTLHLALRAAYANDYLQCVISLIYLPSIENNID